MVRRAVLGAAENGISTADLVFHHFKDLAPAQARIMGREIWRSINLPNLLQNFQATRERASVILRKGRSHAVKEVLWRHTFDDRHRPQ